MARMTVAEKLVYQSDKPAKLVEYQGFLDSQIRVKKNVLDKIDTDLGKKVKAFKISKLKELKADSTDLGICLNEIRNIKDEAILLGVTLNLKGLAGSDDDTSSDPRRHLNFTSLKAAEWLVENHADNKELSADKTFSKWELEKGSPQSHPGSWMNFYEHGLDDMVVRIALYKAKE